MEVFFPPTLLKREAHKKAFLYLLVLRTKYQLEIFHWEVRAFHFLSDGVIRHEVTVNERSNNIQPYTLSEIQPLQERVKNKPVIQRAKPKKKNI